MIQYYSRAKVLKVHRRLKEQALEAVQRTRKGGTPLQSLEVIRLEDDYGYDDEDINI